MEVKSLYCKLMQWKFRLLQFNVVEQCICSIWNSAKKYSSIWKKAVSDSIINQIHSCIFSNTARYTTSCRGLRLEHRAIKNHWNSIEEYFFHIVVVMIMHAWFLVPLLFSKDWSQMGKIQQTVFLLWNVGVPIVRNTNNRGTDISNTNLYV